MTIACCFKPEDDIFEQVPHSGFFSLQVDNPEDGAVTPKIVGKRLTGHFTPSHDVVELNPALNDRDAGILPVASSMARLVRFRFEATDMYTRFKQKAKQETIVTT